MQLYHSSYQVWVKSLGASRENVGRCLGLACLGNQNGLSCPLFFHGELCRPQGPLSHSSFSHPGTCVFHRFGTLLVVQRRFTLTILYVPIGEATTAGETTRCCQFPFNVFTSAHRPWIGLHCPTRERQMIRSAAEDERRAAGPLRLWRGHRGLSRYGPWTRLGIMAALAPQDVHPAPSDAHSWSCGCMPRSAVLAVPRYLYGS